MKKLLLFLLLATSAPVISASEIEEVKSASYAAPYTRLQGLGVLAGAAGMTALYKSYGLNEAVDTQMNYIGVGLMLTGMVCLLWPEGSREVMADENFTELV